MRTRTTLLAVSLSACAPGEPVDVDTDVVDTDVLDTDVADTDEEPLGDPPGWIAPDQRGPYEVGFTTVDFEAPGLGALRATVWYPALPPEGAEPGTYEQDIIRFVSETAYRDAPPDRRGGAYPLVAFSHGFGGLRFQSFFLTEHLASHGWVVVAPDHPLSSMVDLWPSKAAEAAAYRPAQLAAAVDMLDDEPVPGLLIDTSQYAAVGHSFGAWTSLVVAGGVLDPSKVDAVCESVDPQGCNFFAGQEIPLDVVETYGQPDPRAKVAVALAPGIWYAFGEHGEGLKSVRHPLVIGGTEDGDLPYDEEILPTFEALGAPKTLAALDGAGHWAFSDLCRILFVADCAGEAKGFMEPARTQELVRSRVTAWVGRWLLGEERNEPWFKAEDDMTWEEVPAE